MKDPTHYEVLNVSVSATPGEIRRAYRRLALQYHPDRNADPDANANFVRANDSYAVLSDPVRKLSYDRLIGIAPAAEINPNNPSPTARRPAPTGPSKSSAPRTEPKSRPHSPGTRPTSKTSPGPRVASEEILKLTALLSRARYADAERLARRLIRTEPKHPIPYAVLGDIARMRGDHAESIDMYARATQMDPSNPSYLAKHNEMVAIQRTPRAAMKGHQESQRSAIPVALIALVSALAMCYIVISKEPPAFDNLPIVSTWTVGLLAMLVVTGITIGAGLSMAGHLEKFQANYGPGAMAMPPSAALGMLAAMNFWFAVGVYLFVGSTQRAFNPSTSRIVGSVTGVTLLFSLGCLVHEQIDPLQTLLWGGNIIYICALLGWAVSESLPESR